MRTLFLKIFLSFWLSHVVVVALLFTVLMNALERRGPDEERGVAPLPGALMADEAFRAARLFQTGGTKALDAQLDEWKARDGVRAALLEVADDQARSVSRREVPPRGQELALLAARSGEVEFSPMGPGVVAARAIERRGRRTLVLVARSKMEDRGLFATRRLRFEAVRLLAVLIGAAIVAWGLAKYFSAPISRLRRATHQIAEGDLSARVGPQIGRRRDELGELGRDFDLMAGRIEGLMLNERRLLEAERRQALAQRRLLADISHELRSPLARIAFALELAGQGNDDAPKYLGRIERESALLNEMIGQLLTLARLESGLEESSSGALAGRAAVDLAGLVAEVCEDADFEAQRRDARVRVVRLDLCCLQGVPELLRSAVENVVRNAVHYTPEGTQVEVSLAHEPPPGRVLGDVAPPEEEAGEAGEAGQAVIRVRDRGPGVPESALGEMFRPFYRVQDARDRRSGGTGLGLSITERAVRLHGGRVHASNADGGGLEIELRLPLQASDGALVAASERGELVASMG